MKNDSSCRGWCSYSCFFRPADQEEPSVLPLLCAGFSRVSPGKFTRRQYLFCTIKWMNIDVGGRCCLRFFFCISLCSSWPASIASGLWRTAACRPATTSSYRSNMGRCAASSNSGTAKRNTSCLCLQMWRPTQTAACLYSFQGLQLSLHCLGSLSRGRGDHQRGPRNTGVDPVNICFQHTWNQTKIGYFFPVREPSVRADDGLPQGGADRERIDWTPQERQEQSRPAGYYQHLHQKRKG